MSTMSREVNNTKGAATAPGSEKRKKRIYVCCPVRPKAKDPEKAMQELKANLDRAERACELIMAAGGIPLCSPLYCIYGLNLDEQNPDDRALGLEIGMDMLRNADEVNVFSEHISEGMAAEIQVASQLGIPVRMLCEEPGFIENIMRELSDK